MKNIQFKKPINGDVLFEVADGTETNGILRTTVTVSAQPHRTILINGTPAKETENGIYNAEICLDSYRNAVEAFCPETNDREVITLFWFKGGYKTYRVGVDDVIWCLENIYNHQDEYTSIFDDPFLAMYKELHQKYRCHIHMHIYYETVDGKFNLTMFPDKYKEEFKENSDWLRFSFHSLRDLPDSPYKTAPYDLVMKEGRMVEKEILRFAGPEVMDHVTSQHWANSNIYGTRAFRALGFKVLDGYFLIDEEGNPKVAYYLDIEQTKHAHTRDFWVDTNEDIIFVKDDIILNEHTPDEIDRYMDQLAKAEDHCFMYLLIHEQYFYPHYEVFLPDYRERLFRGVEWCEKNGYRSSWISDFAFEKLPGRN